MATSLPTFTVANGIYGQPELVGINGPFGATINYTLDGSPATTSSQLYVNPIALEVTTQINAVATVSGVTSSMASAYYVLDGHIYNLSSTNLLGWYSCSCYGPMVSGSQGFWPDLSGAGNNATQGTVGNQPVLVSGDINNLSALAFNGSSSNFQLPSLTFNNTGLTIVAVMNPTSLVSNAQILNLSGSPAPQNLIGLSENSSSQLQFTVYNSSGTSSTSVTSSSALTANQYYLVEVVQSGTTCTLYVNGVQVGQNTSMNQIPSTALNNNFIGQSSSGGGYFNGHMTQLIYYSTPLSTQQRLMMESYLLSMFQITGQQPFAPTLSINSSTLSSPQPIVITAQPNAIVHFTTDGTTPTSSSPVLNGPLQISYTQTVKAIAIQGSQSSAVASATYTLDSTQWPTPASGGPTLQINLTLPATGIP
jgi:hypothetical protein